jgi:arylsulfate sulfotransferase
MPRSPLKSSALGLAAAAALAWLPDASCAAKPPATLVAENPGANPFIKIVQWHMDDPALLDHVQFTVTPKPGSVTRPLSARYSKAYLVRRGFLDAKTGLITTPVFGLYADYTNRVEVAFTFVDGTAQDSHLSLPTPQYNGGRYDHPDVIEPRTRDTTLSYDFIMLKSFNNGDAPKIIDTDGELRWVGTAHTTSQPVIFFHNSFFVRGVVGSVLVRMEFDGAYTEVANYASQGITTFFHNFDFGKTGILTDVDTLQYVESEVMEVAPGGQVLHIWNFADIISAAIRQGGDDPARFVAAAGSDVDWFHANCAAYRPSDDSLIVSSRENFVMAVDYETGAIKWIFGDPTKAWYQFPSLRKYALKAEPARRTRSASTG